MKEEQINRVAAAGLGQPFDLASSNELIEEEMMSINVQIQITPSRNPNIFKIGFKNLGTESTREHKGSFSENQTFQNRLTGLERSSQATSKREDDQKINECL